MTEELDETIAAGVSDAAKAEGEEAMRIAKLNHPDVDWQADPYTGAPLVPGSAKSETADSLVYAPPPPDLGQGVVEETPEPAPTAHSKSEAKSDAKVESK